MSAARKFGKTIHRVGINIIFLDKFGNWVSLTEEREVHILSRAEMKGKGDKIKETLSYPDELRKGLRDKSVWLYY